ncbi:MAG: hypothetical protein HWE18_09120 [Gammaproteobacteria bacterium]|nr:hypothetical protein [Gammaproteobacteria bacterium]
MKAITNFPLYIFAVCLISGCEYEPVEEPFSSDGSIIPAARFIVQNNYMIAIDSEFIHMYSLDDPQQPVLEQTYTSSDDRILETLYEYKTNYLMIGTQEGSYIKDHTVAGTLTDVDFSNKFTSCDPMVTQGNYLYMALRSGQACSNTNNSNGVNQLLVYNITQITQPVLEKSISISNPYGLGINGSTLFVCHENGTLEFDISNPINPNQIGDYSLECEDLIATEDPMILTSDSGVRLVDHANPGLTELSIIRQGE